MADSEDKDRDLREINNEIVQAMQHWKMTAAQKENEKLQLLRENNELRHQLCALRNKQLSCAKKLNAEMQAASQEVLSHLVKTSDLVTRMLELTKSNLQDHVETKLPRWSSLSSTPTDKVTNRVPPTLVGKVTNRVPPMLVGGRLIQPVVSLSRTLQSNNLGANNTSSPNQNNVREPTRAIPIHMLQDLFIPLTRIDAEVSVSNGEANVEQNIDEDREEDLPSDNSERMEESPPAREDSEQTLLEPVLEEDEAETGRSDSSRQMENPLEGPSWLLEATSRNAVMESQPVSVTVACEFTPTVRRRRRPAPRHLATPSPRRSPHRSPHRSPRRSPHRSPPSVRRLSNSGRILKVMVAKMRLSDDESDSDNAVPLKKSKYIVNNKSAKRQTSDEIGQRSNQTEVPPKRTNLDERQPTPQKISQRRFPDTPNRGESSPTKRHSTDGSPIIHLKPPKFMLLETPSPKGSTDAHVIVLESRNNEPEPCCSGVARSRTHNRGSSCDGHSNHSRSNHGNHNNSNHDSNHANRHNHGNEDNRCRKNSRDTPTNQLSDNSNSNGNHNSNRGNNHANRHNHGNEENRRRKDNRDTPTSQLSDNSNSNGNHNNSNHGNNHANRHNPGNEDNRRRKDNRDTPTGQLSDNSNSDHSNDGRNHTTNMTATLDINCNGRPKKDRRNNNGIDSDSSSNSDLIGEGRTRRPRKAVIYKEKPLNRKLRR